MGSIAPGLALPPMEAVLKWACATLDTHFITLAGLPADAQQALLTLRERIQETLQVLLAIRPPHQMCACPLQRSTAHMNLPDRRSVLLCLERPASHSPCREAAHMCLCTGI